MAHAHTTDCGCGGHAHPKPSRAQEIQALGDRLRELHRTIDALGPKVEAFAARRAERRTADAKALQDRRGTTDARAVNARIVAGEARNAAIRAAWAKPGHSDVRQGAGR